MIVCPDRSRHFVQNSGKGDGKGYVAVVKPGRIIFEVAGVSQEEAKQALRLAAIKLPVTSIIVNRL